MLHVGCPLGFYPVNIQKGVLFILFPFFKRFKNFFTLTYYANRMKQYRLAYRAKVIQRHDFIEGTFSVVRLNLKKGA